MPGASLELLLELVPDAAVVVNRDSKISRTNARAARLFGYQPDEMIGLGVEQLVPAGHRFSHAAQRAAFFEDPEPRTMASGLELHARRKDGSEFPVDISLSGLHSDGEPLVVAAVRDLSEHVQAQHERECLEQELVRARAERERALLESELDQLRRFESLGQLAGGIAHDFNNLLGVIINYAQFAADSVERDSSVHADLNEIGRAAERAAALARQLLTFSRHEAVHREVIDLAIVMNDLDRILRVALGQQVTLSMSIADQLWPIEADAGQLEQVLVNLAINARDAMPDGGTLVIEASNVELDEIALAGQPELSAGPYVRLTVADTGSGMAQEVADRAFEPFFTTKPRGVGTGLGLSTAYGIVTATGGSIRLYSEPGFGTTVKIDLPASTTSAPADSLDSAHGADNGHELVLLVEDEIAVRRASERILSDAGYKVLTAADGYEALRIASSDACVDLLLTDVVMPEMLGPELAGRLLEDNPRLQVLYMSGYVRQIVQRHGFVAHDRTMLEKPFTARALLGAIRQAIDQPRSVV